MTETSSRAHAHFLWLTVTGGGFLDGIRCDFANGLNCVIGGSGSGKTTVLELLAFAVQPSGARPIEHLATALGDGTLRVGIETAHGGHFVIERTAAGAARVFDQQGRPSAAVADQLLAIDHFRVHQIEEIGRDAWSQLRLVDGFAADEMHETAREIEAVLRDLEQSATVLEKLEHDEEAQKEGAREAATLAAQVKTLGATPSQPFSVQAAHDGSGLRPRETLALQSAQKALATTRSDANRFAAALTQRFATLVDEKLIAGPNGDVMTGVAQSLATARAICDRALAGVADACDTAESQLRDRERTLASRHDDQETAYRKVLEQVQEQAGRAEERKKLQQKYATALEAEKRLELVRSTRRHEERKRHDLLERLEALQNRRFARRRALAQSITSRLEPSVRVTVKQNADRKAYQELLCDCLKGTRMQYKAPVEKITETVSPEELVRLVRADDARGLAERANIGNDQAARIVAKLREDGACFRIETVELADVPRIEVAERGTFKRTDAVSTGQRCAAIFSVMLLESARPLLIDQPDDSINGEYLALVLAAVRTCKSDRQMIFVTHNANLAVLCESERVTALDADDGRANLVQSGSVDAMKDQIQKKLEGGVVAFKERMRRYGY